MGLENIDIKYYVPDEFIAKHASREYLAFLISRNSLSDNISEYSFKLYIEHNYFLYDKNEDATEEEWDQMITTSGVKNDYEALIKKIKEQTTLNVRFSITPDDHFQVTGNDEFDKEIRKDKTLWEINEDVDIDRIMLVVQKLGYDNFKNSGIQLIAITY